MQLTLLFALVQVAAQPMPLSEIYARAIDDRSRLSVVSGQRYEQNGMESRLELRLLERGRPPRVMAGLIEKRMYTYEVLRTDDSSVVIRRADTYTIENSVKFFIDKKTKVVVKQIDYPPDIGLAAVDDREVASVLDVPLAVLKQLEVKPLDLHGAPEDRSYLPPQLRDHPMPQPTYREFAQARPDRVGDGYGPEHTTLEEAPGPVQIVGPRIWFGKVFYDGEGHTGVGGIGYFDTGTTKYSFINVPMLTGWSVSALLVEDEAVWIGLVGYPEGAPYPGGLLRYDLKSRKSRKFPTQEVVSQIVRWKDRVYVSTTNGAYQIHAGTLTARYRVEPDINNRFVIVSERPSAKP